jgi:hypothetical protein
MEALANPVLSSAVRGQLLIRPRELCLASSFDFFDQFVNGLHRIGRSLTCIKRLRGQIKRCNQLHSCAFALLPLGQGIPYRVFGLAKSSLFNSKVNEGILLWREFDLHVLSLGPELAGDNNGQSQR